MKSTFLVRALSGVVFAGVVVGAVLWSEYSFAALLLMVCVGSMLEFYKMARKGGAEPMAGYGVAVGIVGLLFWIYTKSSLFEVMGVDPQAGGVSQELLLLRVGGALAIGMLFVAFIIELYRKKENPINNIATTLMGAIYVAIPMALLFSIAFFGEGYAPWVVLWYIFLVWGNDVGAYLFGVTFGKHRLMERISPKKSWEGFFGGLATAIGLGALAGWMQGESVWFWVGLAAVVVVSGVFGDLVESMFKRSVGVKDSGAIMPGHGGFLDRFDALILSAPFGYLYFAIFAH